MRVIGHDHETSDINTVRVAAACEIDEGDVNIVCCKQGHAAMGAKGDEIEG